MLLIGCGSLSVGLGVVGIVVPILPTTPFLILAAICYARSSNRCHQWLVSNRVFGRHLRDYLEGRGVSWRVRAGVLVVLWTVITLTALLVIEPLIVRVLLFVVAAAVTAHVVSLGGGLRLMPRMHSPRWVGGTGASTRVDFEEIGVFPGQEMTVCMEDGVGDIIDIAIIGGGPAGLTAAIYGARARAKTVVFEAGLPGGQIVSASWVENYPGFPNGITGTELGDLMFQQAQNAGAEFRTISPVEAIREDGDDFVLVVNGEEVSARAVILATGAIPKRLGIPGESEFAGRGVSWCATCDGPLYRDKIVAVIGGGDSATQEALYLAKIAREVHLIHRRDELRATPCLQEECFLNPSITMHLSYVAAEILGEAGKVTGVRLSSKVNGDEKILPVDGLFEFVGIDAQSALVADLCELDEGGFVKVDRNGLTSHLGLYAAGDVADYELKQVITACARGAFAVYHAVHYLNTRA